MVLFATLLFGQLSFRHSWERWHQCEGHPFHRADFEVQQVYFEPPRLNVRSGVSCTFGLVESNRQRMNVADDLHYNSGSQAELDHRFPPGTRIPVYLFPDMKGRDRVQVYEGLPPAEASQRMAIKELRYSLMILVGTGAAVLVPIRLRRLCVAEIG